MEGETAVEGTENETPATGAGDVEESKAPETTGGETGGEDEGIAVAEGGEAGEAGEGTPGGETGETAGTEEVGGEHAEREGLEGEHVEGEFVQGEAVEGEHVEGEQVEGQELVGEGLEGEHVKGEQHVEGEQLLPPPEDAEEEEGYIEEPPPDPAAPFDFSDSKEALKAPFKLRPDQEAEVEQLWELFQNYTPAYSDLDGYITEKELIYMLKSLFIMTFTAEQLQELIQYCCRPPNPDGHIFYDQFLKMVAIRQRDFPIEEELRSALRVFDTNKEGVLDREEVREILTKQGHKMSQRLVDSLIKEVDMTNDGTIGIDDIVGTMCIDLNPEDILLLRAQVNPPKLEEGEETEME